MHVIDADKVSAWAGAMHGMFASNSLGMYLVLGFSLAFIAFVLFTAWSVSKEPRHHV